jgi:hypothetical protein
MDPDRSDDVRRRAQAALAESPIYDLRGLRVEPFEEGLLISGRVTSFYHKQLAQEVVRGIAPQLGVRNVIDVS